MLAAAVFSQSVLRQVGNRRSFFDMLRFPFPSAEKLFYSFHTNKDLARWKVFTDMEFGGKTTASLNLMDEPEGGALFSGVVSLDVLGAQREGTSQETRRRLVHSGFCGITATENKILDIGESNMLSFRMKSDGRKYLVTLRTENWLVGSASQDVWHAFLFGRPGQWEDVDIPFSRFLLTHRGKLVETRVEMNPDRIISLGISLAGGSHLQAPGPFSLGLQWIKGKNTEAITRPIR
eukprot:jgi/Botrbrau1/9524/Bobra.0211s0015.1